MARAVALRVPQHGAVTRATATRRILETKARRGKRARRGAACAVDACPLLIVIDAVQIVIDVVQIEADVGAGRRVSLPK